KLIRESDGKADAAEKLKRAFKLDDVQAEAILDAQLYKIAQMEIQKILDELQEKQAEAERIEGILKSNKKLWKVVREELEALGETYGGKRNPRTSMGAADGAAQLDPEGYISRAH